jgi:F-type H+-transporting ATPase subunit epsilon
MHLSIVTPQKAIYDGDISSLSAPTTTGEVTILPEHINLLTQLVPGELTIKSDKTTQYMGITGGFLEMNNDKITILADFAVASEHIAVEKAIEAQQRAEELKKRMQENLSEEDLAIAAGELRRSLMELHVAQRKRRRHL